MASDSALLYQKGNVIIPLVHGGKNASHLLDWLIGESNARTGNVAIYFV